MRTLLLLILLSTTACSCINIKYEADNAFLNSAQANSMELLVRLNGSPCMDMDDKVGLCAKRIPSDKKLVFTQDARPYGYRIYIKCSRSVDVDQSFDIEKDAPFKFEILPEKFIGVKSFTCIGEIFPADRDQEVSALWSARIVVFDKNYTPRTSIYKIKSGKKKYLILGKNARYSFLNGKWKKKKTHLKVTGENNFAYSESERMRFNYWRVK